MQCAVPNNKWDMYRTLEQKANAKQTQRQNCIHAHPASILYCVYVRYSGTRLFELNKSLFSSFFVCIFLTLQHSICSNSKWNERLPHLFAWYVFHMSTYTCFINFVIPKHFVHGNGLQYRLENLFSFNFMETFIQFVSGYLVVTVPHSYSYSREMNV